MHATGAHLSPSPTPLPAPQWRWAAAVTLSIACGLTAAAADSSNWPQFRGPGALGVSDHPGLPERWSTNENVAWKQ
ncbi:MAG TPA: hypothetical protein VNH84_15910, partial [Candidatus Saccharimonadales bacterium]|nr:hypothetical protein [Candidatus Saccharimonadales bacterium]